MQMSFLKLYLTLIEQQILLNHNSLISLVIVIKNIKRYKNGRSKREKN